MAPASIHRANLFEHEQPRIVAAATEIADKLEVLAAMLPQVSAS